MEEPDIEKEPGAPAMDSQHPIEYACLLGVPPFEEFQAFIKTRGDARGRPADCDDEWNRAAARLRALEPTEGGFADGAAIWPLPEELCSRAKRELEDPGVKRSLSRLRHHWALVDLDQVVVHQRSIDLSHVKRLASRFPTQPTDEQLFCLAAGSPSPGREQIHATRHAESGYTFASRSSDLRVLETTLLDPGGIPGYCGPGRPSHVVAVAIGYGINLAAAFHVEGRLIFHNGTHRAAAAYTVWGIRKFPCVVREVSTAEDLDKVGAADVKQHLHLYLRSRRPPRLRDFFDPALHTKIRAAPGYHLQHVQINTQRLRVSAP